MLDHFDIMNTQKVCIIQQNLIPFIEYSSEIKVPVFMLGKFCSNTFLFLNLDHLHDIASYCSPLYLT